jgi:hypothetical protein
MPANNANSDWKSLYETAMRELDSSKLAQRITIAREAILNEIEDSIPNPALKEQCTLDNALRNLRRLATRLNGVRSPA